MGAEGVYSGRGPLAEAGDPQAAAGDIREEGRGATAPLAHLPGKFAPAACTKADRKGEPKLSVPESALLCALFILFWCLLAKVGPVSLRSSSRRGKAPAAGGI